MDVAQYTQSSYGRLLEHAIEVGAPDGLAAAYVDQVLLDNRRLIRRSRDPDPLVREALTKAIRGGHDHGRSPVLAVAVVLALVAAIGGAALAFRPEQRRLPSLAGYDATQGEARLRDAGWDVLVRPVRACEPADLVTGTDPPAGTSVGLGAAVSLRVAYPFDCPAGDALRSQAWDVVRWARDLAPAPALAADVEVVVDGEPGTLAEVRRLVAATAAVPAQTPSGILRLDARDLSPGATTCGTTSPASLADRVALRVTLDPAPDGRPAACPLTLDLYRTDALTDAVVVRTARAAGP